MAYWDVNEADGAGGQDLPPELAAQLRQQLSTSMQPVMMNGKLYQGMYDGGYADERGQEMGQLSGIVAYDPNNTAIGSPFRQYDAGGKFARDAKVKELGDTWMKVAIAAITGGAAMGLLGGTLGVSSGAGAAGAAGAGGAGAGAGAMGVTTAAEAAAANAALASSLSPYAAGAAGAAGAGAMTVPTAAEAAAASAALEGSLAPYAAGAGAAGGAGAMTVPTAAQSAASSAGLASQLAPYAAGGGLSFGSLSGLAGPAASLIGGAVSANAAEDAAEQQQQSARDALALQERMFNKTVELNEPFRQVGVKSINRLGDLTGVSGNTGAEGYGDLTRKFDMQTDYLEDPGYQFRLSEGNKALTRQLTAGGQLYSGRALKDTTAYNSGMASQEFGNAYDRWRTQQGDTFNRLSALSGTGQVATGAVSNAGANYGNAGASLITGAGNAKAAGTVGQANAWGNALNQGLSMYQTNELMDRYLPRSY